MIIKQKVVLYQIAKNDKDALIRVRNRLIGDFGGLHEMVLKDRNCKAAIGETGIAPFWGFARMIFPIAESIGDLIYRSSTTENLQKYLENDLSKIDIRYSNYSAILPQLFRHSLIHQDELRTLVIGKRKLAWALSMFGSNLEHLNVYQDQAGPNTKVLHFDLTSFYNDLMFSLDGLIADPPKGCMERYNSWLKKSYVGKIKKIQEIKAKEQIKEIFKKFE